MMQNTDAMLEMSLNSSNRFPWYALKAGESNRLSFTVKNCSGKTLFFESEYGIPPLFGSTEIHRSTSLFLCFGSLLSEEEVKNVKMITPNWNTSVEIREKNGEVSHYLVIVPQKEKLVDIGEEFQIELTIEPKSTNEFSYVSIEIDNLKFKKEEKALTAAETIFIFPIATTIVQKRLELISGIVGDDSIYVSKDGSIRNKFSVFLINTGHEIDFSRANFPKLSLQFSEGFSATQIQLLDGRWDTTSNTGEFELSFTWNEGGVKELNFTCTMNKVDWTDRKELIVNLRIETLDIPGFKNHTFYIPMKLMLQKQIGNEALSIQINHESIHIQ